MALGDLNIIGDVTQTLKELLSQLDVTLDSPANLQTAGEDGFAKLNLYLYQVLENPFSKNQEWSNDTEGGRVYPPLAVDLYYLLTPYASDAVSSHQVLCHAMLTLHENAILRGPQLKPDLRLAVDQLAVVLCPLKLEELTRIWNALQKAYRLSVAYQVRIVLLESQRTETPQRVVTKVDVLEQL